jgi:addiction module antidote protein, HigA family
MINDFYFYARKGKTMDKYIETPKISEVLYEEFMKPLGISAYKLAQEIHVPVSRIQDILHDRRKITADTSIRLAKFFGVSDRYFLDIQNDIDIRELKINIAKEIDAIKPLKNVVV